MNKRSLTFSLILNILIFIMVTLGTIFMFIGFKFMSNDQVLSVSGIGFLRYYTVDSNILVGFASLMLIICECLILNKKINEIPKFVYIFKYISTVAVSLTFLVTLFYLAPMYGDKFLYLYQNSNLFFHLLVPLLSFISFTCFEKVELDFKYTFAGISTMIAYGLYYLINILIHQENGKVSMEYDLYGFVKYGISFIFIVFPLMLIVTYIISLFTYKANKPKKIKETK